MSDVCYRPSCVLPRGHLGKHRRVRACGAVNPADASQVCGKDFGHGRWHLHVDPDEQRSWGGRTAWLNEAECNVVLSISHNGMWTTLCTLPAGHSGQHVNEDTMHNECHATFVDEAGGECRVCILPPGHGGEHA